MVEYLTREHVQFIFLSLYSVRIWEIGCQEDFHCGGGAVCVDNQCACPTGYRSVAGNTKCAKMGGKYTNEMMKHLFAIVIQQVS